jgi:hypothetical protein
LNTEAEVFTSEKVELLIVTLKDEDIEVRIFSYENGVIRAYFTYPNYEKGGEKYTQFFKTSDIKIAFEWARETVISYLFSN